MEFKKVVDLPEGLTYSAIEDAVKEFVKDSHTEETHADPVGLFQQTLEVMASVVVNKSDQSQCWLAHENGEVFCYVLAHVSKDVDNKWCYWITQAWVNKKIRGKKEVKEWYQQLRQEAKRLQCSHIIVPSSRGVEAYLRFLGKGWHLYLTLLKEDI